jgi:hypothetical protein
MGDRTSELVKDYEEMRKSGHRAEPGFHGSVMQMPTSEERPPVPASMQHHYTQPSLIETIKEGEMDATAKRLLQYDRIIAKSRAIFEDRNRRYGDAIVDTGLLGAVVNMAGDYGRLKKQVIRNPEHGRDCVEDVEDKCVDMLNYLVIAQMMIEEGNFDGR